MSYPDFEQDTSGGRYQRTPRVEGRHAQFKKAGVLSKFSMLRNRRMVVAIKQVEHNILSARPMTRANVRKLNACIATISENQSSATRTLNVS